MTNNHNVKKTMDEANKKPKENKPGVCRNCQSTKVDYTKHMGFGMKMGKVYHYKLHCDNCHKSYHIKSDSYVYNKVKDKPWILSKSAKAKNLIDNN